MTKLLPCPRCGGVAELFTHTTGSYGYYPSRRAVRCTNSDCSLVGREFVTESYDWPKQKHINIDADALAAEWWNTRSNRYEDQ